MSVVEQHIDVGVPVAVAYGQWTQFDELPLFMQDVEEVRQIDPTHLRWRTSFGGVERIWTAEIVEQRPDERIAWRGETDLPTSGAVTFHRLDARSTRVTVVAEVAFDGQPELSPDAARQRLREDLERFKQLLEERAGDGRFARRPRSTPRKTN
jgi:uncharacterized membrane protein